MTCNRVYRRCCCRTKDCSAGLMLHQDSEFYASITMTGNPDPHSTPIVWLDKKALEILLQELSVIYERLS